MVTINHKSNGYTISDELKKMIDIWKEYLFKHFKNELCHIELFNYGDKLVMATVNLINKSYAHFNITAYSITFDSYTCTNEEYDIFYNANYKLTK